ncbi:MAG: hypothetical protein K1X74_14680 [Pirellulales bacterium]|nr:hypothetical protein [Pirellulales bacterium]
MSTVDSNARPALRSDAWAFFLPLVLLLGTALALIWATWGAQPRLPVDF